MGKPLCGWGDPRARDALVGALVRDAQAALPVLDGHESAGPLGEAAVLLALVAAGEPSSFSGTFRRVSRLPP